MLNCLIDSLVRAHFPGAQCGFRAGHGTIDMVFSAMSVDTVSLDIDMVFLGIQEKCQEQYQNLYTTFVDVTQAFDTSWQTVEDHG